MYKNRKAISLISQSPRLRELGEREGHSSLRESRCAVMDLQPRMGVAQPGIKVPVSLTVALLDM